MKIPFLNKNFSSSFSSNSNSTSWPCPSCHQTPRTLSFRATLLAKSPTDLDEEEEEEEEDIKPLSANIISSSSSTDAIEELQPETEDIENVIKGIKSSKRLIFERKGESNSILEEVRNKDSCSCPWKQKQSTLSLNSSDSWWRWLRYTHVLMAREASKCIMKTTK